jgi:hypothetical protein
MQRRRGALFPRQALKKPSMMLSVLCNTVPLTTLRQRGIDIDVKAAMAVAPARAEHGLVPDFSLPMSRCCRRHR